MNDLTAHVAGGEELSAELTERAAEFLLSDEMEATAKGDFLRALQRKGETAGEIAGFAQALLRRAVNPEMDAKTLPGPLVDVCGTGGDRLGLFNISTTAMFILAAAGAVVVKHGNRGITSRCGGADVLEELGVVIDLPPAAFRECVKRTGLGFLFAPAYHPAFKSVGPVRRALAAEGITTIFNILGPLLNPARPDYQLVGVFARSLLPKMAGAFQILGRKRAWAVHGGAANGDGVDEVSTMGETEIVKVEGREVESGTITPEELGMARVKPEELRGGDRAENGRILTGILDGTIRGAKRDAAALNAAAGMVVAGLAGGLQEGLERAEGLIDSGGGLAKLEMLRAFRVS